MSDQSADPVRGAGPRDDAEREARIEELLLSGLDHYFAGQYDRAISVWSRIVFLDRSHDRARAYIERARSALAERQRASEELLHDGVAAYNAGEVDKARDLLTRAAQDGSETADLFLHRLNRVGSIATAVEVRPAPGQSRTAGHRRRRPRQVQRRGWLAAACVAAMVAAVMLVGGLPIGTWLSDLQGAVPSGAPQVTSQEPLPVVRRSETELLRARELYAGGHLRDALRVLQHITLADPARAEADRLRADIQRHLFVAAGGGTELRESEVRP